MLAVAFTILIYHSYIAKNSAVTFVTKRRPVLELILLNLCLSFVSVNKIKINRWNFRRVKNLAVVKDKNVKAFVRLDSTYSSILKLSS